MATGRRPACPARRLGRLRPALAAGSGIGLAAVELLRVVVDHPGGVVQLVRAGGRLAFVVIETARPGPRVVFRIVPELEWEADRFGRILAGGF